MILISHRGNLEGPSDLENHPDKIQKVLRSGFDCEIDLWREDSKWYLGHDYPEYEVNINFFCKPKLWIHAKNLSALNSIPRYLNFFWHEKDDFALTSKHFIWTYPNKPVLEKSVIVDNTKNWKEKNYKSFGVCSDWIL